MNKSLASFALFLFSVAAFLGSSALAAQTILVNDTTISESNLDYEGEDLVVDGAILTVDGNHSFSSVLLKNGATLRHSVGAASELRLNVAGIFEIDESSKVDVSARGRLATDPDCSGCGGAYASAGGMNPALGFGDYTKPAMYGEGGAHTASGAGTRGGGRFYLDANKLILAGGIFANGESQLDYFEGGYAGGGAGGSISIYVDVLEGNGLISANGAGANTSHAGGGSGGRVAIYYGPESEFDFVGLVSAKGGTGKVGGGPGTVHINDRAIDRLYVENNGGEYGSLAHWVVESGAPGVRSSGQTPSASYFGGYYYLYGGGNNSESSFYQNVKIPYSTFTQEEVASGEISLGISWLQSSWSSSDSGEVVFRFRDVEGDVISEVASGLATTAAKEWERKFYSSYIPPRTHSVDLVLHSVRGAGSNNDAYFDNLDLKIYRNIESEPAESSGSLFVDNHSSGENVERYRISGVIGSEIYLRNSRVELITGAQVLGSGFVGGQTGKSIVHLSEGGDYGENGFRVDRVDVIASGSHEINGRFSLVNSAYVTMPVAEEADAPLSINAENVFVDSSSKIDVSGKGVLPSGGIHWKSGGSYGGVGGIDPVSGSVNSTFGSMTEPTDFGVGGYGADDSSKHSRGGGAVKLVATKKIEIYGDILANGSYLADAGGGSGGSVWIEAAEIVGGSGTLIEASGGYGYRSGIGGGGRIALYYGAMSGIVPSDDIFARAGTNYSGATGYGGPGTVYLYDRSLPSENARLQIINRSSSETYPPYILSGEVEIPIFFEHLRVTIDQDVNLTAPITFKDAKVVLNDGVHLGSPISGNSFSSVYVAAEGNFTVPNNNLVVDGFTLELPQDYSFETITLKNSAKITTPAASEGFTAGITLNATDFYVSSNSYIDVSGKGRLAESGRHWKSGGSYGGLGGI
ncbi:hypothetical protein KUV22_04350, partial [Microbulbifer agarilyticus]